MHEHSYTWKCRLYVLPVGLSSTGSLSPNFPNYLVLRKTWQESTASSAKHHSLSIIMMP